MRRSSRTFSYYLSSFVNRSINNENIAEPKWSIVPVAVIFLRMGRMQSYLFLLETFGSCRTVEQPASDNLKDDCIGSVGKEMMLTVSKMSFSRLANIAGR